MLRPPTPWEPEHPFPIPRPRPSPVHGHHVTGYDHAQRIRLEVLHDETFRGVPCGWHGQSSDKKYARSLHEIHRIMIGWSFGWDRAKVTRDRVGLH